MDNARRELQQVEQQLKDITDDQARLRANLKEMPSTAEAYKRYLKKFDDQETQIEELRKKIKEFAGYRVRTAQGLRGLPRQARCRVTRRSRLRRSGESWWLVPSRCDEPPCR